MAETKGDCPKCEQHDLEYTVLWMICPDNVCGYGEQVYCCFDCAGL